MVNQFAHNEMDFYKINFFFLRYASPSGLFLTLVVHVVYRVALRFER